MQGLTFLFIHFIFGNLLIAAIEYTYDKSQPLQCKDNVL